MDERTSVSGPRWITEALQAVNDANQGPGIGVDVDFGTIATALIERLPIEAMTAGIRKRIAGVAGITGDWIGAISGLAVTGAMHVLTDGDPEVVELSELYQGATRALDAAGVPYAVNTAEVYRPLNLAGRIAWLAEQRPTRLELQRVEAERDAAIARVASADASWRSELQTDADSHAEAIADASIERDRLAAERDGAIKLAADRSEELARTTRGAELIQEALRETSAELEQLRKMYEGAGADLDAERRRHQTTIDEFAKRELELIGRAERAEDECGAKARKVAELEHMAGAERESLRRVTAEREALRSDAIHARALADEIGKRDAMIKSKRAKSKTTSKKPRTGGRR